MDDALLKHPKIAPHKSDVLLIPGYKFLSYVHTLPQNLELFLHILLAPAATTTLGFPHKCIPALPCSCAHVKSQNTAEGWRTWGQEGKGQGCPFFPVRISWFLRCCPNLGLFPCWLLSSYVPVPAGFAVYSLSQSHIFFPSRLPFWLDLSRSAQTQTDVCKAKHFPKT